MPRTATKKPKTLSVPGYAPHAVSDETCPACGTHDTRFDDRDIKSEGATYKAYTCCRCGCKFGMTPEVHKEVQAAREERKPDDS
jgi:DNA-directed RNA polymerase subunit M/transcription elongation factor TFIIS